MALISFVLNGASVSVDADPASPLVDVLRTGLGLTGTKRGCDYEGECGACTVLLDGQPVRSCLTPVGKVAGRQVLTVEGLGEPGKLHPLQAAFIEVGAIQCGYCTPGMLLAAKALLDREPEPSEAQIVEALAGNLCRCTGYTRIVEAVQLAAARLRGLPEQGRGRPRHVGESGPLGGSALRSDSIAKVTGQARYVEDVVLPGMLYGRVLRSQRPHARLRSLGIDRALHTPGVVRVLTADDVPGLNSFADYSQEEPVLPPVGTTVRMVGAPLALVVATTPEAAAAGLEAIEAELEALPQTFQTDDALRPDATPIAGRGNILTTYEVRHGDLAAAMAGSDVVVETEFNMAFLEHGTLEREALLGYLDDDGRIAVAGGTHQPHLQQGYVAEALGLPRDQVRIIMPPTGGSFGSRQDPWPFIATALMVYHVRQPVRLAYSRRESFLATPKRHPYHVRHTIGATRDGLLTGIRVRIDANTGGYDAHGQYIPNYAVTASGGPYRWQAVDAAARTVYTNGPKAGQFRGFGTAQSVLASECALDELCQALGCDPVQLRLKNSLQQHDCSFLGYPVAESLGFREVLEAIRPHYEAYAAAAEAFNAAQRAGRRRRGVGLAGMWYRFGKSGSLRIEAHAELAADGSLVLYCSAPDYGQGTNTTMAQMAAEAMGVSRDRVRLVNADTALVPDSGIQGASRATYFVGGAVGTAVSHLKQEVLGIAAEMLDEAPARLAVTGGRVAAGEGGARAVSLAEVAREFDRIGKPRRVVGYFDLSDRFPAETRPEYVPFFVTGAHLAQAEVDLSTGQVRVLRMVAAHDVGRAVNPPDARGQIEGAVLMGLGAALLEEYIPGHTTGLSDYYLPTAQSMPQIDVLLVEVPSYHGPYGVKGLGEAAMLPSTPAIINAVSRAIGRRLRTIPATPERVLWAIRGGLAGEGSQ